MIRLLNSLHETYGLAGQHDRDYVHARRLPADFPHGNERFESKGLQRENEWILAVLADGGYGRLRHMKPISRRDMLTALATATSTVALPAAVQGAEIPATSPAAARKRKIIVAGGHPGDPEYGCGGTIARFTDLGDEVVLLYLNRGDPRAKTPEAASGVRVAEATRACEILKARPVFAAQIDGNAIIDPAHREQFYQLLAAERPDAVFTHWPIDNHADHRAITMLVYDAWTRLRKSFALYFYEVSNGEDTMQFAPTHYVDISATSERKRQACFAHASQAPEKFYSLQESVTRFRGIEGGCRQAEAYVRHIQSPAFELPLLTN
jgi:N-acetylglucosamine malate deacetylase 1